MEHLDPVFSGLQYKLLFAASGISFLLSATMIFILH